MKTTNTRALCALSLTLLAPSILVSAQPATAPDAPLAVVTQIEPDPGMTAPHIVVPQQTKLLQNAIKKDDWDAVSAAIKAGADVNGADKNGTQL